MKSFTLITAVLAGNAYAFPRMTMDDMAAPLAADLHKRMEEYQTLGARQDAAAPQGVGAGPLVPPPFDAKAQYVSNQGKHKFVPPGPGDARGQCPGLNAMANHNYLPHNGVATITQFTNACQEVFGMGADLALFLAAYGAVVDGTLTSWSIGGKPHTGIAGSHGNYESDSSPLKSDLYQYGSLEKLVISQFKDLYNRQPDAATANYNLDVLREFRKDRFQESIDKNPKFYYGPFTGMAVSQAAFTFIYRFMANKSEEAPEGILDKNTLKSFMSITGSDENPKWTFGHEKIPDNWYKRNTADAYTIPYCKPLTQHTVDAPPNIPPVLTDILYFSEVEPRINGIGCNQGRVDSYNAISAETLSNGAYTVEQAAQNPLCFATEFAKAELPGLTGLSGGLLAPLNKVLNSVTSGMNCAAIGSVNTSALAVCPGLSLYGGPHAPVAKGAIQN